MALENNNVHCSDECVQQLKVQNINRVFKAGDNRSREITAACFYACWYASFISSARVIYSSYAPAYVTEIADISFTDGLLSFMQKASAEGLYESNATAKSVAFSFFKNKLHEWIRKDKMKKNKGDEVIEDIQDTDVIKEDDEQDKMLQCLELIRSRLSEEDNNICKWKYEEKLSNSEVAAKLGIATGSFTNRLYRLTGRLENLMNECLKSQQP